VGLWNNCQQEGKSSIIGENIVCFSFHHPGRACFVFQAMGIDAKIVQMFAVEKFP
jgi:hypothetical protein